MKKMKIYRNLDLTVLICIVIFIILYKHIQVVKLIYFILCIFVYILNDGIKILLYLYIYVQRYKKAKLG